MLLDDPDYDALDVGHCSRCGRDMAGAPGGPRIAENRWEWLDAIEMFNRTSAVALKPAAQVIAYSLSRRAMDAQEAWPPQAHLAAATGMSRRAVQRAVDELEAAGFLVRRASQHRAPRYAFTIPAGVFAASYQPAAAR